jgi:hypothetical protein
LIFPGYDPQAGTYSPPAYDPVPEPQSRYLNQFNTRVSFDPPGFNDYNGGRRSGDPFEPRVVEYAGDDR